MLQYGQLGTNNTDNMNVPTPLSSNGMGAINIYAGNYNSYITNNGSKSFAFGRNHVRFIID
jgi:hypothetical protein